jgi:hypothetical protein
VKCECTNALLTSIFIPTGDQSIFQFFIIERVFLEELDLLDEKANHSEGAIPSSHHFSSSSVSLPQS